MTLFLFQVCAPTSLASTVFFSSVCPNICGMRWQQPFKAQPVLCPKFSTWAFVVAPRNANTSVRRKPERKRGTSRNAFYPHGGGFSALLTKHTNGNFFSPFLNMYPYKPWGDFVDPLFVSSVCPNISGVDLFVFFQACAPTSVA